jgi:hypothetical protein
MTLEKLERQVLLWNRAAILAPVFFTGMLMIVWFFQLCNLQTLFFIACGLYFFTAVICLCWTMKSIHLLVKTLTSTKDGILEIADELRSIRNEIELDRNLNN